MHEEVRVFVLLDSDSDYGRMLCYVEIDSSQNKMEEAHILS